MTEDRGEQWWSIAQAVDIARQGEDQTVIRSCRGLDARSIPAVKFRIPDLMATAGRATRWR